MTNCYQPKTQLSSKIVLEAGLNSSIIMASMFNPKAPELLQAQTHLYKHVFSYMHSMSLKCAVQLNIPDVIHKHGKPITLPELATSLNVCPTKRTSLYRLMRILVQSGFFATTKIASGQEDGELGYILTPPSNLLVKDNPNCLSPFVMSMLDPNIVFPSHQLADCFRGNENCPFEKAHGMTVWDHSIQNPEIYNLFNEAMACDSQMTNLAIRDVKYVFEGIGSIVDVGGGTGSLARFISEAFPEMKCVVLDLPSAVANSKGTNNLEFVGGDMFQYIPSADAVILKVLCFFLISK